MCAAVNALTQGKMGIAAARSVWSASSLLALSLNEDAPKAGASSTHSKRFARRNVRAAPEYVTGLAYRNTASDRDTDLRVSRRALPRQKRNRSSFLEMGWRKQHETDEEHRHN